MCGFTPHTQLLQQPYKTALACLGCLHVFLLAYDRKAVKEQLKTQGLNSQIKSLVTENKSYKPVKGKEGALTQQQAIDELKVISFQF